MAFKIAYTKMHFRDSAGGAHDAPPDPSARRRHLWGGRRGNAPKESKIFHGLSHTFPSKAQENLGNIQSLVLSDRVWTSFMWCKLAHTDPFSV